MYILYLWWICITEYTRKCNKNLISKLPKCIYFEYCHCQDKQCFNDNNLDTETGKVESVLQE